MNGFSYGSEAAELHPGAAADTMALAGHGLAHVSQPAGQVTASGVGAAPEVKAPAGHGLSQDSHPAGHVTAVAQSPPAMGAVGSGAAVMSWARDWAERRAMESMVIMLWDVD